MQKLIGYINLYSFPGVGVKFAHWSGSVHDTEEKAIKYKDRREAGKVHTLGKIYIETNEEG